MATDYKKNAAEAKEIAKTNPAAAKIIAQATKTGEGLSNNELAFIRNNASKITDTTNPVAFLGTLQSRLDANTAVAGTPPTNETPQISAEEAARRAAQEIEAARLQTQRVNWIEQLNNSFAQYGLGSLASKITEYVQQGYSADTVSLKLQEAPEYKQRFAGNELRKKVGLPVLTPGEYLSAESSYKQIMRANGLPQGFYDSQESLAKFISNDVSPSEFQSRVNAAGLSLNNADPFYTQSLQEMYGLTQGEMLAHVLDPQQELPFINKQVQAAQFGAEARRQGLSVGVSNAEQYANMGVTQKEAQQGFEQVAQILPGAERLSQITAGAQPVGMEEVTSAVFGGAGSAAYK